MQEPLPNFRETYEHYKSRVFNTVISYVQSREDAEEITQDVFVEMHRSLNKFKGDSTLGTWIYRIAVNKSLDHLKSRNRKKRFAFITSLFDHESGEIRHDSSDFVHPGVVMENKERSVILFKAIHSLPENQKTAFILSKIEGLGNKEIAEIMGNSVGAVESLQSRAKENLKKGLEGFYKNDVNQA
jgi:RNA polymerase sigma-70 factor (ECF subfamily)